MPDSPMRVVVFHTINGATKSTAFTAPTITAQTPGAAVITLLDENGRPTGYGHFSPEGIVVLAGTAIDQYQGASVAYRTQPGDSHA